MSKIEIIQQMKQRVFEANMTLPQWGLVKLTWGNVSEINRELGVIVIKPSGVDYAVMSVEQMVVTDLNGNVLDTESLNPSSDLPTHVVLYKAFEGVNAIVHTHSTKAVCWAQSGRDLPIYGTTHADAFYGDVPNTRMLNEGEVVDAYEANTGHVIVESFAQRHLDPLAMPGILVCGHGPFTWGKTTKAAVQHSLILEEIAEMAQHTEVIGGELDPLPQYLADKHYNRKHGKNAYYGQKLGK